MEVFVGDTKENSVPIIKTGGDKAVNQDGSGVRGGGVTGLRLRTHKQIRFL